MKKIIFIGAYLLIMHLYPIMVEQARAQQQQEYRIEMNDGNVFIGTVVSETEEEVILSTDKYGELRLFREYIQSINPLETDDSELNGFDYKNPQPTRYLFAPNAVGMEKGKGYYQNTWVLFNNLNYGLSNNFSIGAGTIPLFLFGSVGTPIWILPKVSTPIADKNIHLAAGAMIGGVIGEQSEGGGIFYGASTFGDTDQNMTIGVGYGYSGGDISDSPVLNISGMSRLSTSTYLISENYFFPNTDFIGAVSLGVRWAPENFAVDFALVRPLEEAGSLVGIPWLGITIPFGH